MIRLAALSACALATVLAAGLHAQERPCPGGPDDTEGLEISSTVAAHPSRVADIIDSVLVAQGYAIRSSPAGAGTWNLSPITTFVGGLREEVMQGLVHPGVQMRVRTEARGDSVDVSVLASTVCATLRNGQRDDDAETALEMVHTLMLSSGIEKRAEALQTAGVDLAAAVARSEPTRLTAPDEIAGFRRIGRRDFDDPAAGVSMRYGRDDRSYVDIYVYPGAPRDCDAACGARSVNEEADGFIRGFPDLVRAGYYRRMDVRADETVPVPAGAPWLFGRHLVMDVEANGAAQVSHYYLFAFPGYKVKVRATFPPSAKMTAAVQAFVDALLPAMTRGG
jgi:hypothetical protein